MAIWLFGYIPSEISDGIWEGISEVFSLPGTNFGNLHPHKPSEISEGCQLYG